MAIRDKIAAKAAPHLRPGEVVQATFIASRANPMWVLVSWIIVIAKGYYAVVATDQRILVFRTSGWAMSKLKALHAELPRAIRFGEPSGKVNYKIIINGEAVWVHRRFWSDLRAADAALG